MSGDSLAYDGAFVVAPSVVWRDVPGEIVLFEASSGAYHALNPSAAEIWRGLAAGLTLNGVAARLAAEFDQSATELLASARAFASRAERLGLLAKASA